MTLLPLISLPFHMHPHFDNQFKKRKEKKEKKRKEKKKKRKRRNKKQTNKCDIILVKKRFVKFE
jgi:hypothetical protein